MGNLWNVLWSSKYFLIYLKFIFKKKVYLSCAIKINFSSPSCQHHINFFIVINAVLIVSCVHDHHMISLSTQYARE